MSRLRISVLALSIAVASAAPLCAQQTDAQTHTVKKGDTLWDLAKRYLGDSYLWPEIYRINTDKIEDPHWIYPGEVLKLPGKGAIAPTAAPTGAAEEPAAPRQRGGPKAMTVFNPNRNVQERKARESLNLRPRAGAVRPGDYRISPYAWKLGGPNDGGVLESAAEGADIKMTSANRPIQYLEPVFVHIPKGAKGDVGEEYTVFRLGDVINGNVQAVIPTGIVKITSAAANGRARAQLTQKFEDVFTGQGVTPLDSLHVPADVYPARVEFGLATRVTWLDYKPVLPGGGAYFFVAAGSRDGIVTGDQLTIFKDRGMDSQGVPLPEEEVAVAQVTRVTQWGSAAVIIKTMQAGVAEGTRARITAKMP